MVQFADMQPRWEKGGVKFHRINADQSLDKNKTFTDALKGDYSGIKTEQLNPLAEKFITAVKSNRPNLPDSVFTGKVFFADEALNLGLIDSIGTFDSAISVVTALAAAQYLNNSTTQPNSIHNKPKTTTMDLPLLIALLQVSSIETTQEGAFLNVQQLEAIEAALAKHSDEMQSITESLAAEARQASTAVANAEAAQKNAENALTIAQTAQSATITALNEIHPDIAAAPDITSKVEAIRTILSRKPASAPVGIKSDKDPVVSDDGVDWETLNSLPHMQVD
jgi:protease-4